MRRLSGFSLMEMMTVLLIVSVVAAASAPMINKRMMVSQGAGNCPWETLGDSSISFNQEASDRSVIIGANATNNGLNPKLHIRTNNNNPFITFQQGANNQLALNYRENTLGLSANNPADGGTAIGANANAGANGVAVGNAQAADRGVAIGSGILAQNNSIAIGSRSATNKSITIGNTIEDQYKSQVFDINSIMIGNNITKIGLTGLDRGEEQIAIGYNVTVADKHQIAIGGYARTFGTSSIAIGQFAKAGGDKVPEHSSENGSSMLAIGYSSTAVSDDSIAIGSCAKAGDTDKEYSIAIGYYAKASEENSIAIGRKAEASGEKSVAIGQEAVASGVNSIAIGHNIENKRNNVIQIGNENQTVYIPGNLVVGGYSILGYRPHMWAHLRIWEAGHWDNGGFLARFSAAGGKGSDIDYGNVYQNEIEYFTISGRRLKNVGKAFTSGLAEIKKLEVFNYTFKKDESKTPRVGVMAQDLQKIFPNAVTKGEDGFLRIRMEDMFYAVVNAVKELDNKFDLLAQKQKKIDELEAKLDKLEKRLEKLEKQK